MKKILASLLLLISAVSLQAKKDSNERIGPDEVWVKGDLIDIREVMADKDIFPQNKDYVFSVFDENKFGRGTSYAVSLVDCQGPSAACFGKTQPCRFASTVSDLTSNGWKNTGETFDFDGMKYYVYEYQKYKTGEWVEIPYSEYAKGSNIVFGKKLKVVGCTVYGKVIAKVPVLRKSSAYDEGITLLPDGTYIAACSGAEPVKGAHIYASYDKGETWTLLDGFVTSKQKISHHYNVFVHNGALYVMGCCPKDQGFRICRSDDGGKTWTEPVDEHTGYLLKGTYHSAPVPVAISGGRIWRGCETRDPNKDVKKAFMMSAPVDADLLEASSWTVTNTVTATPRKVKGKHLTGTLIEGNAVALREGGVVNLIRTNSTRTSKYATILHLHGLDSLYFDPVNDVVEMPGGGKKFTCRYDPESDLYWALTNPDMTEEFTHAGIYKSPMSHSLMRNRLVVVTSPDLRNWTVVKDDVLYDPDPFFHGFQYPDWVIDGNDMAVVVRVGAPEERGLPVRQHDSNMMCFLKIKDFRKLAR